MKLYYSPGACSLADHIALREAKSDFDLVRVDIRAKKTEHGDDFKTINPKGYVPALTLDGGETISENIAILSHIADQTPSLTPTGTLGRTRLIEALAYISTEVHKGFKPFFTPGTTDDAKQTARDTIAQRLQYLSDTMVGTYLLGDELTTADAYLFVMLLWSGKQGVTVPAPLAAYRDRVMARPAVQAAMQAEG